LTQEILGAVRFVKYFGWEVSFLERIENIRRKEIRSIQWLMAIRNAINAISMSIPIFASMLAFITYALTSHALNPAFIFSSLALFNSIRIPLNLLPLVIGQVVDAASSIERIQEFLLAEDAQDEAVLDSSAASAIRVEAGEYTWENARSNSENAKVIAPRSKEEQKQDKKDLKQEKKDQKAADKEARKSSVTAPAPGALIDGHDSQETLQAEEPPFKIRDLNFSVARNELVAVIGGVGSGKSSLLAALAGDMRRTAGTFTMGASRAFCPQYAWIQNATLQENILFGKPMKRDWYNQVVEACALGPDLDMLPNGDQTEIGERGITVSGGQKQRLNIARAIYFDSDIVLMDDPLSAVDAHVGKKIMDEAICGLLANKCRILATHQLWVLNKCDRIIWLDDGRIQADGTFDELMANNPGFVKLIASNAQEEKIEEVKEVTEDALEEEKKEETKAVGGKKPAGALMQAEERATKGVDSGVYLAYIRASGSIAVLPFVFLLLVLAQGSSIVTNLWLSYWTSDKFHMSTGAYIGIYAALGVAQAVLMFAFSIALSIFGTTASKVMLHRAITRVLRAPMSFFDTTPLGRITNRFSKDVDTMDNVLTDAIRFFAMTMGMIVSVFILIIVYYYYFVVALAPLLVVFVFSASYYRSSAREIKRHESVLRSGVFAKFSEAVNGIATIRAYGMQKHFATNIRDALDEMNSAYFLTFANQRWLSVRLDFIGNLLVFVVGILGKSFPPCEVEDSC
jgi:ATP-binding cassette subfamily C (CFTR/MRP) protein 1